MAQAAKKTREKFLTPIGRFNFPNVFHKAKAMDADGKDAYDCQIVFDKEYLKKHPEEMARFKKIQAGLDAACVAMFKKPVKETQAKIPRFWNPVRQGEEKEHLEGYGAGTIFFKAKTYKKPGVVGPDAKTPIDDEEAIYSGCYGRLSVTPFAYGEGGKNTRGGKGVSLMLNSVMFVKDGERLDGGSNPEEDFGEVALDDPDTGGGDDDDDLT